MNSVVVLLAVVCALAQAFPRAEDPMVRGQQQVTSTMSTPQNGNNQMTSESSNQAYTPGQQSSPDMQSQTNPSDAQMTAQGQQTSMYPGQGSNDSGYPAGQTTQYQSQPTPMNQQGSQNNY